MAKNNSNVIFFIYFNLENLDIHIFSCDSTFVET